MPDTVQRVDYFYVQARNKPGEGARYLAALQEAGINLVAFSGFPEGRGSQLDFVPADAAAYVTGSTYFIDGGKLRQAGSL